jgi:uncharacterized protein YcgI (DUF1989 family)
MADRMAVRTKELHVCYVTPKSALVDTSLVDKIAETTNRSLVKEFVVPKKSGHAWPLTKGDVCRITVIQVSQVGN